MNYTCKECDHSFSLEKIKLETEKQDNKIEQIYYICPNCGHRYDICKTSQETRNIQNKIKSKVLLIKSKLAKGTNTLKDAEQLNKLIIKHKKLVDELNSRQGIMLHD